MPGRITSKVLSALGMGGHILGIKEFFDMAGKFLEQHKDNPLLKALIEKQFGQLKEEIFTHYVIGQLETEKCQKLEKFLLYLSRVGQTTYIQEIQNIVFTLAIFENIGLPLTRAGSEVQKGGESQFIIPKDEKPTEGKHTKIEVAKKFLEELADNLGQGDDEKDFQAVKDHLKSYRLIGQKPLANILSMLFRQGENLGTTLPTILQNGQKKITAFWKEQFPDDKGGGLAFLTETLRERQKRRRERRRAAH